MVTLLGSSGFIGTHLKVKLNHKKIAFTAPVREEKIEGRDLGDVIYCIGLTSDFRQKPHETIAAHISCLSSLIQNNKCSSLTYLSSTRIYIHNKETHEDARILLDPNDPFDLYNVSKLAGEMLVAECLKEKAKIVRLSNVYGNDFHSQNFLTSIIQDAVIRKKIVLRTTEDSAKDYISVDDVSEIIIRLALKQGVFGCYNLAYGENISNREILESIQKLTGCEIQINGGSDTIIFPKIMNQKIKQTVDYTPKRFLLNDLEPLIRDFRDFVKIGFQS